MTAVLARTAGDLIDGDHLDIDGCTGRVAGNPQRVRGHIAIPVACVPCGRRHWIELSPRIEVPS